MAEEGELLAGQEEVLVGIRLGENVIVFVGDRAVNHLRFCSDIDRPYGKTCQIFPVRIGQHRACPVNGATRVRIELRRFVQARRDAVVVPANGDGIQVPNAVNGFYRARPIANDVAAAKHEVISRFFCALDAGFERFYVGMDVTEDEIPHGVLWSACDSRRS